MRTWSSFHSDCLPNARARCLDVGYELLNEMGIRAYNQTYLNEQDATPGNQGSEDGMSWGQFAESSAYPLQVMLSRHRKSQESMGMDEQTLRDWMGKKGIVISTPKATRRASQPRAPRFLWKPIDCVVDH